MNDANQTGFVPSNYVRRESLVDKAKGTIKGFTKGRNRSATNFPIDEIPTAFSCAPDPRPVFSTSHNNHTTNSNGSSSARPPLSMSVKATVKFSYDPRLEDELRLTKGEIILVVDKSSDGWWKGESNGSTGWFPSNYVEEIVDSGSSAAVSNGNGTAENRRPSMNSPATAIQPPTPVKSGNVMETVIALYAFEASTQEELSFSKGEQLDIVDHPAHDPDWWMARNSRGNEGLVPRNYIEVIAGGAASTGGAAPAANNWSSSNNGSGGGRVGNGVSSSSAGGALDHEPWYFGRIGRDEADRLLSSGREGEYLVRDSESNPGDWSISMRGQQRNKHFKVQSVDGELRIGTRSFSSMQALILHYTTHPIFSSGDEKLYLTRPLPR